MKCRPSCGACCIAPSINSPIPGMPDGKPAGVRCIQLLDDFRCAIFDQPERPTFCVSLLPSEEMCGNETIGQSRTYAIAWLNKLEELTRPL
ncbi:MAG: YkgJ family cysteine cluster protein [Methylotenera sp.]